MVSVIAGTNETTNNEFDYKIIKKVNSGYNDNYLISPLSMGFALSMLNEGAAGITREEIDNLLGNYQLLRVNNIKDRIGIANALFINNIYKKDINKDYKDKLESRYGAELIYDNFNGPKTVNNWVNKKTFKMIPNALERLDNSNVLVIVNTIAIDLEWKKAFDEDNTRKQDFTLIDGSKMNSAMMHESNNVSYIKSDRAQGIIKDYKSYDEESNLEYIAILPNGDINEYINNFDNEEFDKLLDSRRQADDKRLVVNYALPKYTYDFDYKNFKNDLISLGMVSAFGNKANFSDISETVGMYVDQAIHKTHIEVSEKGTKAAAVTAITTKEFSAAVGDPTVINITFDKPFIYIIKDRRYQNIWFFGVVYKPMKWEDNK
jgi:serpin B